MESFHVVGTDKFGQIFRGRGNWNGLLVTYDQT